MFAVEPPFSSYTGGSQITTNTAPSSNSTSSSGSATGTSVGASSISQRLQCPGPTTNTPSSVGTSGSACGNAGCPPASAAAAAATELDPQTYAGRLDTPGTVDLTAGEILFVYHSTFSCGRR